VDRTPWIYSILFATTLITSTNVFAQDDYVAWGDARITEIRRQMRDRMTPAEFDLEKSIIYRVAEARDINAVAVPTSVNGKREIVVSSSLLRVIDAVVTMEVVSVLWNKTDCIESYLDSIQSAVNSNGLLALNGLHGYTQLPFPYMKSHPSICAQVSPDVITNDVRQSDTLRSAAIYQSIKWVLLHEFAHHLHNDVHSKDNLTMDREQERQADAYATISMLHPPEDPMQAAAVMLLFCSLEGFRTGGTQADHPHAVERLKAMVDATRSSPQFKKTLDSATTAQRKQMESSLDQLDQMSANAPSD
jgi:hypothetical protein